MTEKNNWYKIDWGVFDKEFWRKTFWYVIVAIIILTGVMSVVLGILIFTSDSSWKFFFATFFFACFIPFIILVSVFVYFVRRKLKVIYFEKSEEHIPPYTKESGIGYIKIHKLSSTMNFIVLIIVSTFFILDIYAIISQNLVFIIIFSSLFAISLVIYILLNLDIIVMRSAEKKEQQKKLEAYRKYIK